MRGLLHLTVIAVLAAGVHTATAQMTGPIDMGTIRLNPSTAPPPTPARRASPSQAAPAAPARNLDIKTFFGSFAGSGVADGDDTAYYGVTQRDLDVRISAAADGGFTVAWTTVLRAGGDMQNPNIRRRATTMTFRPGPRPGLFTATDNGDPLRGGMTAWARLARSTLTIYLFSVQGDGRHEIQTYARTLSGTGMDLIYTRIVDGERQRRVRGKLVKNVS